MKRGERMCVCMRFDGGVLVDFGQVPGTFRRMRAGPPKSVMRNAELRLVSLSFTFTETR
jgi:hypothetical protein